MSESSCIGLGYEFVCVCVRKYEIIERYFSHDIQLNLTCKPWDQSRTDCSNNFQHALILTLRNFQDLLIESCHEPLGHLPKRRPVYGLLVHSFMTIGLPLHG